MTVAGITVTDPDSLEAAAAAIHLRETYADYLARRADEAAEDAIADGWTEDEADDYVWSTVAKDDAPYDGEYLTVAVVSPETEPEPEPPAPISAALAFIPCAECRATGTVRHSTGFGVSDWIEEACGWCKGTGQRAACPSCRGVPTVSGPNCWYCQNTGLDHLAGEPAPAPVPFDRAAHCRRIGQLGGYTTLGLYGSRHMAAIGRHGYAATAANHGREYALGLIKGKGWEPKPRPDLLADLRAGRERAGRELAALASAA